MRTGFMSLIGLNAFGLFVDVVLDGINVRSAR